MKFHHSFTKIHAAALLGFAAVMSSAPAQVLSTTGLTGYFGFESNFNNSVSGGVNATALNSATAGNSGGLIGNAVTLQPTTTTSQGYAVGIGYGAASASTTNLGQNFTISTWFKLDNPPVANGTNRYFIYEGKTSFDVSVGLRGDLGGATGINDLQAFTDTTTTPSSANSANFVDAITPGAWQHVMQTYAVSGAQTLITTYINGVEYSTVLNPTTVSVVDTGMNFGRARDGTNTRGFDGQMDETAMFSRAVSDQEAYTIYNMGKAGFNLDASINSMVKADNTTTLATGSSWAGGTAPGSADYMIFDSTYTQTGALDTGAAMTVVGLRVTSGSNLVDVNNTSGTLTVGALGIDMSGATRDLTVAGLGISGSQNWNIATGRTFTAGASSALTGAFGITKMGAGTAILGGSNTYSGETRISAGTLRATGGSAIGDTSAVVLDNVSGATFQLDASETVGSIAGGGTSGGNINLQANALTTGGNNSSTTYAGTISGTGGSLVKNGTGTLTLSVANSYTGGTTINGGTIRAGTNTSLGSGAITAGNGAAYGAGYASGGTPFLAVTSTAAATLANDIALPNPGSTGYYALQKWSATSSTGTNLDLTGTISGGGANMILQLDSATPSDYTTSFTLSGTNSLAGTVRLNRGAVILTNASSLGTAELFVQSNPNAVDGNIRFTNAFTLANNITFGATANNTINTGANDVVLSGTVTSGVAWAKVNGTGKLTLSGTNNITGVITISAGTMQIGNGGTTGSLGGSAGIVNNAALVVNRSDDLAMDNAISGTGTLTKTGAGALTLGSASTYSGATNVNNGTLLVNNTTGSGTGSGTVNVASGATLGGTGALSGAVTVTGKIAPGAVGIESLGTGAVTWKGASTAGVATDWEFQLGAGNSADKLDITGNFTKDTTVGSVFNFDFLGSSFMGIFTLAQWTGTTNFVASDFSYTNLGAASGTFTINGLTKELQFTAVPEPTGALAGVLLGAGMLRRRRKA